jgi:AraC-like DNA-binding protein
MSRREAGLEALRTRLRAAADAIAQAIEEELAAHPSGERLLTLDEAAERLGRHPATLRRRFRQGQLEMPVVEEDGDPRVRQADVDAYIRELKQRHRIRDLVNEACARRTA